MELFPDKYEALYCHIKELFTENSERYGYRRIHAWSAREGIHIMIIEHLMKFDIVLKNVGCTVTKRIYQNIWR